MEEILCGIDWASDHHDVALINAEGTRLGRRRISDDAAGLGELAALFAAHGGKSCHVHVEASGGPVDSVDQQRVG